MNSFFRAEFENPFIKPAKLRAKRVRNTSKFLSNDTLELEMHRDESQSLFANSAIELPQVSSLDLLNRSTEKVSSKHKKHRKLSSRKLDENVSSYIPNNEISLNDLYNENYVPRYKRNF